MPKETSHVIAYLLVLFSFVLTPLISQNRVSDTLSYENDKNIFFHSAVKQNEPISQISFPFIGDFHFKNYQYVEQRDDLLRYNYFLVGADLYPSYHLFDKNKYPFNVRLSFGTKIRVWNKRRTPLRTNYEWRASHAIKTPSFMPGIYFSRLLNYSDHDNQIRMGYIEVGFTHHSNGQDAPTLASQDSSLLLPPDIKYNIEDGDFSANNLTIKYYKINNHSENYYRMQSFYFKLDAIGSGKFDHNDLHKYIIGYQHRFIKSTRNYNNLLFEKYKIQFSISLGIVDFDSANLTQALSYSLSYHYKLPFSSTVSIFCEYGYLGQDDYNIYLEQSLHYFRFGISMSTFNLN